MHLLPFHLTFFLPCVPFFITTSSLFDSIQEQWEVLQEGDKDKSEDKPEKETSTAVENAVLTNNGNNVIVNQPGKEQF